MSIRPRSLRALGAAAAGLAFVGLAACGSDDEPERDETTNEVTEAGDADVFSMAVGDCVTDTSTSGQVSEVPVVPCTEPHVSEVFHSYQIPAESLPGTTEMQTIVEEQCVGTFETFVGLPFEQSALDITWLEPTAGSWDEGDRELLCMVYDPAGEITGSLGGAAR